MFSAHIAIKVSVIIPNYNHARFLRQRIDSVLAQTYQNFELIILDDCSQDESRVVIEGYRANEKVAHIVFNEKNSGSTFQQWKKGIELARGEWIWIAESDDFCDKSLLATLIANTDAQDSVVLSYSQSYCQEEGSLVLRDMSFHTKYLDVQHWQHDYINNGRDEIQKYLLHINSIPNASAVIFKKSAYLAADGIFEQMRLCGDWMLWVQLLKRGDLAFSAKSLNYFRTHSTTTRVLDTAEKKKLRLEEEYMVATDIRRTYSHEFGPDINKRVERILQEYNYLLEKRELFKFTFFPFLYKGRMPLLDVLISRFHRRFKVKLGSD